MTTKEKSKYDTTPGDISERPDYPNGYYPNGEWAGFFAGENPEQTVIEWCKKEKGRTFNWVPRPKPEPRAGVEDTKRRVKKFSPVPASKGHRNAQTTKRAAGKKEEDIEWDVEDIKDDEKLSKVAKKSQDAAIKKLTKGKRKK